MGKKILMLVLSIFIFVSCISRTELIDFKPNSLDEELIKNELVKHQTARNNWNITGIISCYTDDAKIMTGGKDRIIVSKNGYTFILQEEFRKIRKIFYYEPKIIFLNQEEARVMIRSRVERTEKETIEVLSTFFFVYRNGGWKIRERIF